MKLAGKTDIGTNRTENQDNYRAGRCGADTVWAVVCDGMGGAKGGAAASRIATDTMEEIMPAGLEQAADSQDIFALMRRGIQLSNNRIYEEAQHNQDQHGMGTTMVCMVVRQGCAYYSHVGDSRLYHWQGGQLVQKTRDHSMVQQLVENGSITPEEAEIHPRKNLITRAIGVEAVVASDEGQLELEPEDILLLCSDGLTNAITPAGIGAILGQTPFFDTASALVDAALTAGGQDNITVVLVQADRPAQHRI